MAIVVKKSFYEKVKLIFSYFRLSTWSDPDRKPSNVSKKSTVVTMESDRDVVEAVLGKALQITIQDLTEDAETTTIHRVKAWICEKKWKELIRVRINPFIHKEKTGHCMGTIDFLDTADNILFTCQHQSENEIVEVFGATGTPFGCILRNKDATLAQTFELLGITKKPIKAESSREFHAENNRFRIFNRRRGWNGGGYTIEIYFSPSFDAISKTMLIAIIYFMIAHPGYLKENETIESVKGIQMVLE